MSLNKKLPISAVSDSGTTHFNIVTWTGDGNNNRQITGVGFQPAMVWIKKRSSGSNAQWMVLDIVRGVDRVLDSSTNAAQYPLPGAGTGGYVPSFDLDGFTLTSNVIVNGSGETYVAFCWKLPTSTSTNSAGDINTTLSTNDDLGLSVTTHLGTRSGATATIGHGLSAIPDFWILKNLNSTTNWRTFLRSAPSAQKSGAFNTEEVFYNEYIDPTSTLVTMSVSIVNGQSGSAANPSNIVMFIMRNSNFMQFGTYEGSTSSVTISGLPFQPRFIMTKNIDEAASSDNWYIQDSVRGLGKILYANESSQESSETVRTTFNDDGFTIATGDNALNENGQTFMYWVIK